LIKELPSLIPNNDVVRTDSPSPSIESTIATAEKPMEQDPLLTGVPQSNFNTNTQTVQVPVLPKAKKAARKEKMGKSPGEIAFFKLLHSELKKGTTFFEQAKKEFTIREARVREGMEIFRKPNMIMVSDKWSIMAKSIYRLYKDLLLLELYAIMTYTSFSKILKKHDKVTGYETRIAFMANVVNKASFVQYPDLLAMIQRAQKLFDEVSQKLLIDGNSALCEDEKLFISMIHRFYGQIMDKAAEEGAPDAENRSIRNFADANSSMKVGPVTTSKNTKLTPTFKDASTLKSLVEENDATKRDKANGCLSDDSGDAPVPQGYKRTLDALVDAAVNESSDTSNSGLEISKRQKFDADGCS
jgi:hypothetical protein